jgi:rootletin
VEALERAAREKEAMAKERAGLAVKLAAAEREGRTLSEEAIRLR